MFDNGAAVFVNEIRNLYKRLSDKNNGAAPLKK